VRTLWSIYHRRSVCQVCGLRCASEDAQDESNGVDSRRIGTATDYSDAAFEVAAPGPRAAKQPCEWDGLRPIVQQSAEQETSSKWSIRR